MRTIVRYACDTCHAVYETTEGALKCEDRGVRDMARGALPKIGAMVECGTAYGWHDEPDTIWTRVHVDESLEKQGRSGVVDVARGGACVYARIWIVAATTVEDHRTLYHLYCPVDTTGKPRLARTSPDHMQMRLAAPSVPREAWRDDYRGTWTGLEAERGALV